MSAQHGSPANQQSLRQIVLSPFPRAAAAVYDWSLSSSASPSGKIGREVAAVHYFVMKTFHLVGVIFLLGNVSITFMWTLFADDTSQPIIVAFAQRMVNWNDWAFTVIGALLIVITGYGMAGSAGLDLVSQR